MTDRQKILRKIKRIIEEEKLVFSESSFMETMKKKFIRNEIQLLSQEDFLLYRDEVKREIVTRNKLLDKLLGKIKKLEETKTPSR